MSSIELPAQAPIEGPIGAWAAGPPPDLTAIKWYSGPLLVPGLLHTREWSGASFDSVRQAYPDHVSDEAEEKICELRHEYFAAAKLAVVSQVLVDELSIRLPSFPSKVMRDQARAIRDIMVGGEIDIRILPTDTNPKRRARATQFDNGSYVFTDSPSQGQNLVVADGRIPVHPTEQAYRAYELAHEQNILAAYSGKAALDIVEKYT